MVLELVKHYREENARFILERMKASQDLGGVADEVEDSITELVAAHATEVAVFKASVRLKIVFKQAMDCFRSTNCAIKPATTE